MTVPFHEHWFSLSIRRNRKSFVLANISLAGIIIVVGAILVLFNARPHNIQLILIIFAVPYVICSFTLSSQRLRDIGVSGWLSLLWIPIGMADAKLNGAATLTAWIVLIFVPGTKGPNNYGEDPKQEKIY